MKGLTTLAVAFTTTIAAHTALAAPTIFEANGASAAAIQATVDAYRTALGTLNANVAGSFGSGRREINWDGVPDNFASPNALPLNFFNANSPRGAVFATPGTEVRVSADNNNPTSTPTLFDDIATNGPTPIGNTNFQVFSPQRLFAPLGSNITDVLFFVPGSNTPALTRGFGSIFVDVDTLTPGLTKMEFFDVHDALLDTLLVPVGANQSLSFLGADYGAAVVSRVRITTGDCILPTNNNCAGTTDLVVMDDFIYGEPVAAAADVPTPAALLLLGSALAGLAGLRRRC